MVLVTAICAIYVPVVKFAAAEGCSVDRRRYDDDPACALANKTRMNNLFGNIPDNLPEELFSSLLEAQNLRVERIVSQGHRSPVDGWYDQSEHEWVLLVSGAARLIFCSGQSVELRPGDYLNIPAHEKHRVAWTDPDQKTVWLAIFYRA